MLIGRFSPASSLAQRGIIIVGGKPAQPAPSNGLQERGIIIVGGKPTQPFSAAAVKTTSLQARGVIVPPQSGIAASPADALATSLQARSVIVPPQRGISLEFGSPSRRLFEPPPVGLR